MFGCDDVEVIEGVIFGNIADLHVTAQVVRDQYTGKIMVGSFGYEFLPPSRPEPKKEVA
jgi:hypothetical protein